MRLGWLIYLVYFMGLFLLSHILPIKDDRLENMKKYHIIDILWSGTGLGLYEMFSRAIIKSIRTYVPEGRTISDLNLQKSRFRVVTKPKKFSVSVIGYILNGSLSWMWLACYYHRISLAGNYANTIFIVYLYITILSLVQLCNFDQYTPHNKCTKWAYGAIMAVLFTFILGIGLGTFFPLEKIEHCFGIWLWPHTDSLSKLMIQIIWNFFKRDLTGFTKVIIVMVGYLPFVVIWLLFIPYYFFGNL
jgi:hypothetical protein